MIFITIKSNINLMLPLGNQGRLIALLLLLLTVNTQVAFAKKELVYDAVYMWVNGSDPVWQENYKKYVGEDLLVERFRDNNELRYSLRSIEKFAPYFRKIFIVTDNQVPDWLETGENSKLEVIYHSQIFPN